MYFTDLLREMKREKSTFKRRVFKPPVPKATSEKMVARSPSLLQEWRPLVGTQAAWRQLQACSCLRLVGRAATAFSLQSSVPWSACCLFPPATNLTEWGRSGYYLNSVHHQTKCWVENGGLANRPARGKEAVLQISAAWVSSRFPSCPGSLRREHSKTASLPWVSVSTLTNQDQSPCHRADSRPSVQATHTGTATLMFKYWDLRYKLVNNPTASTCSSPRFSIIAQWKSQRSPRSWLGHYSRVPFESPVKVPYLLLMFWISSLAMEIKDEWGDSHGWDYRL